MNCSVCGSKLVLRASSEYHFEECGLDYVYLKGITIHHCPHCSSEAPEIGNMRELHLLISLWIVQQRAPLTGPEIKFLRKNLGLKAKELARQMDYDPSTFSRFENDKEQLGPQGDRLLRVLFLQRKNDNIEKHHQLNENGMSDWWIDLAEIGTEEAHGDVLIDPTNLRIQEGRKGEWFVN